MPGERVLVPVAPSPTLRETVEYVVDSALDAVEASAEAETSSQAESSGDSGASTADRSADAEAAAPARDLPVPVIHFVYVTAPEDFDPNDRAERAETAEELLERVAVWAREDAGDREIEVHTARVGTDRYLFSPADVASVLADAARERADSRIVLDPEYDPGVGAPLLRPLAYELSRDRTLRVEEAPVQTRVRRSPLLVRSSARRVGALAGLSFVFYQVLAGSVSAFDLVTGVITAIVVAGSLSHVSFGRDPTLSETPVRLLRGALYVPYLLWEIVVANLLVARVILDPRLSIDPRMTRIRPAVYGALPVTSLANSITLTPGTLTVRVQGRELLVHTLLLSAREDLFDGSLERAVRFVFYGRRAMRIDSLRDRDAAEVLVPGDRGDEDGGEAP